MNTEENQWISVNDRLPEENQIVDVWQMPKTRSQQTMRGLEKTKLFSKHEYTGWRSNNYRYNKNEEEQCNVFLKVDERTLQVESYPHYKELVVENGEVTYWMPLPKSPNLLNKNNSTYEKTT